MAPLKTAIKGRLIEKLDLFFSFIWKMFRYEGVKGCQRVPKGVKGCPSVSKLNANGNITSQQRLRHESVEDIILW